jgi:hypothetical protein
MVFAHRCGYAKTAQYVRITPVVAAKWQRQDEEALSILRGISHHPTVEDAIRRLEDHPPHKPGYVERGRREVVEDMTTLAECFPNDEQSAGLLVDALGVPGVAPKRITPR